MVQESGITPCALARMELGDFVERGDAVVYLTDPFGRVLEILIAPADGNFLVQTEYPVVNSGVRVATLGTDYREFI